MKLATLLFVNFSLMATAVLNLRRPCNEDNCWRALWGTYSSSDHPLSALTDCEKYLTTTVVLHPVTTATVVCRDTTTIPGACPTSPVDTTGAVPSSSFTSGGTSSTAGSPVVTTTLTGFPEPSDEPSITDTDTLFFSETFSLGDPFFTSEDPAESPTGTDEPVPTGTGAPPPEESDEPPELDTPVGTTIDLLGPDNGVASETGKRRVLRQVSAPAVLYSTTTRTVPVPAYATAGCANTQYASACACKEVTRAVITLLSTTITNTVTTTLSYLTTQSGCETSAVTVSRSSSRSLTTVTSTSSSGDTATRTGSSTLSFTSSSASRSSGSATSIATDTFTSNASQSSVSRTTSRKSTSSSSTSSASQSSVNTILTSTSSSTSQSVNTATSVTLSSTTTSTTTPPSSTPTCTGPGWSQCKGKCTDTKSDLANCGSCGSACKDGFDCVNGVCARPPCDSNCAWDRTCGSNNGTSTSNCICATEEEGHGICFDKDRFSCSDGRVRRCRTTAGRVGGCPVGFACIKEYCNCGGGSTLGICVSTAGCTGAGVDELGPLVRVGEMEQRRRTVKGFVLE